MAVKAVVANEALVALVALVAFKAYDALNAVSANDAEIACDEVIAKLPDNTVPKPVCNSLPLICTKC